MTKAKPQTRTILLDPAPKGDMKFVAGADHDEWNLRLTRLVLGALPLNQLDTEALNEASVATLSGMVDMKPADPVEGMLIGQLVVAHEAAMKLYRRAWASDPADYFEGHTKLLQLADKAQRTVALLSERLDQHRNRGQQQIVVKHVTVNADQAVVTDSLVTGNGIDATTKCLTARTDKSMEGIQPSQKETVPVVEGGQKAK